MFELLESELRVLYLAMMYGEATASEVESVLEQMWEYYPQECVMNSIPKEI